jgi:hypothetical protein
LAAVDVLAIRFTFMVAAVMVAPAGMVGCPTPGPQGGDYCTYSS